LAIRNKQLEIILDMLILTAAGEVEFSEGLGTSAIVETVHIDVDGANKEPSLDMGTRATRPFFKRYLMIS
jgi:hypothetical protein